MRYLLVLFNLLLVVVIPAQEQLWIQLEPDPPYGGYGWKAGIDLNNNIYVISGWSYPGWWDNGSTIIKYSPGGEKLWTNSNQVDTASIFGYVVNDYGYSFVIWNEANFFNYGGIQAVDSSGNEIYSHSFYDYTFYSVDCDNDGNAYVTGTKKISFNNWDLVLIKYNTQGELEWEKTWSVSGANSLGRKVLMNENGIYAAGNLYYSNFILKYDQQGNLLDTSYFFQGASDYIFRSLKGDLDSFGNIYLYGLNEVSFIKQSFIYKFDSSLNKLWHDTTTLIDQGLFGMSIDENQNVILCGYEMELNHPIYLKYKSDGDKAWHLTLNEGYGNFSSARTKGDRIYYIGDMYYPDSAVSRMILYSTDHQGNYVNQILFPASGYGSGEGSDLITDHNDNLIAVGTYEDTTDYCMTIKFDLLTGTKDFRNHQMEGINVFPNPFNDIIKIGIRLDFKMIEILDLNGITHFSKTLLHENKTEMLDLRILKKGIYILKVKTQGQDITKKIIKI
jgi:hypothetical protein